MFDNLTSPPQEWLLTNGLGGYAMGCVDEANRRKYHSLLITAIDSPSKRFNLLNRFSVSVLINAQEFILEKNSDYFIVHFINEGQVVHWEYEFRDFTIRKSIWMTYGHNQTNLRFEISEGAPLLTLLVRPYFSIRDHHTTIITEEQDYSIETIGEELLIQKERAGACRIKHPSGKFEQSSLHELQEIYMIETMRGENDTEICYSPGVIKFSHSHSQNHYNLTITDGKSIVPSTIEKRLKLQEALIQKAQAKEEPIWFQRAVIGADKFIVKRGAGKTILAGYPWFTDWGRDTMIALPGLLVETGRAEDALQIVRSFANYVSEGMLPNLFPDTQFTTFEPDYNTVDATLWFFHAIDSVAQALDEKQIADEFYSILKDIYQWHIRGTRYGIVVDPNDGLLTAGTEKTQLTWMDVRIGDEAVTPRSGKAVEINALWIRAMRILLKYAVIENDGEVQNELEDKIALACASFQKRFWNGSYLYDLVDGPEGDDNSLRPNQLFAITLVPDLLTIEQKRSILSVCDQHLLTPYGLRSLSNQDDRYIGVYQGAQSMRDRAYHQGTVWPWLLGVFCEAHYQVYQNAHAIKNLFQGLVLQLDIAGLDTVSENTWGDPPFYAVGCPAQAWSQAELSRIWRMIKRK